MTHREFRVFSQTDDKDQITRIGEVACKEFNFDRFVNVEAVSASNLKNQYSADDFIAYVTQQSLNGLNCFGNESTIKECQVNSNFNIDTPLFELEVECLCKYILCLINICNRKKWS
jgi:hypothetical protein